MKFKLVVIGGKKAGMEIPISMPKYLIGRGSKCHLRPQSPLVSRKHCVISTNNGSIAVEDCGSANGTLVNGEKIQRRELKKSDRIKIGTLELEVQLTTCETTVQPHNCKSGDKGITGVTETPNKPSSGNGVAKKQPPHASTAEQNGQGQANNGSSSDRCEKISGDEVDFLGWLDGKSTGNTGLPVATRITAKSALQPQLEDDSTYSLEGEGNGHAIACASEKSDDLATVGFSRNVDRLLRDSPRKVGGLRHSKTANLVGAETQAKEEWDGTDLLLLAALGILLVVVLSWLFPMSWPETFSLSAWLKRCLQIWWQKWWLRWGAVAILIGVLIKLLCIRARSEKHG